ncbi:succinylglutamate desuccinylase/aspartoacylase family protein [Rhodobacteraceae bacterium N5(2021)]|uniref:Succinylglutamate desuccinylase/aspartoacylase family protein n=1 Tax=Gymnodinialimonas phycosphaerae TaxID=2841589 RepID=A0A975YED9_9RHOB|nr:succinylglutamate desuccinylase/aspartoacylase family protein [Gymnodinialimonas phycosphaerae]MBY4893560.1 succinylglutamate desuccinylase/aspartoacylase family protein [Gymnodinialimonas phycosphaerae]
MTQPRNGSATGLPNPYPVELTPPDITAYAKGTGDIPYIWTFDSGAPGPHVAITAIVHGNEPCGALALDWLMRHDTRPVAGKLSFAFMNVAAHDAFDPDVPDASRWVDEDLNRLWAEETLDDPDRPLTEELRRAREVRPWLDTVDMLLDIHSMQNKNAALTIAGLLPKGRELARDVGYPPLVINDQGHAEGLRMRDYGGFGDPASPRKAMLVECGQHWESNAEGVALETAIRFLRVAGAVTEDFAADWMAARAAPDPMAFYQVSRAVTIETDEFQFAQDWKGLEALPEGTLIGTDGTTEIRAPHPVTVLIMPSRRLWRGKTSVRLAEPVAG